MMPLRQARQQVLAWRNKLKMPILFVIQNGPQRFGQLPRFLHPITEQMLTR